MKIALKKITIVAEKLLQDQIVEILRKNGSTGWTITAVEGEGSRGNRSSDFEGRNAKIQSIVSPETADIIMDIISEQFFEDWAIIAYTSDVEVMRGKKYLGRSSD